MTSESSSSLERMLGVLDLFDETHGLRTAEEIAEALEVSIPTSYRYVRTLVQAGLLQRIEGSRYALGPRVILLDHYIRQNDPVLRLGTPVLQEVVAETGLDCVVTALFGLQVLETHREQGRQPVELAYGRGRPRPLFAGAAPKVLLATLGTAALHKVFDQCQEAIAQSDLPQEWSDFRRYFTAIRKAGHYCSLGELEPQLGAVAVPILKTDGSAWAALSLVFDTRQRAILDLDKVTARAAHAARRIEQLLT